MLRQCCGHARACTFPYKLPLCLGWSGPAFNTWFLRPTQVRNPHRISIGSAIFAQLTLVCGWACPFPKKIAPSHGMIWTSMVPWTHTESKSQTSSWSFQPIFAQLSAECHYFTISHPFSPLKLPLSIAGSEPPSNTWFLGPSGIVNPNRISISSAIFAQLAT